LREEEEKQLSVNHQSIRQSIF